MLAAPGNVWFSTDSVMWFEAFVFNSLDEITITDAAAIQDGNFPVMSYTEFH